MMPLPKRPITENVKKLVNKRLATENLTGKELDEFMKLHGIDKYDMAEIFGVTPQAIELWVTGKRGISVTNTRLINIFKKYPHLLKEF